MSATDRAFLRELPTEPSRPRFAATGPRPRGALVAGEHAERIAVARIIREARVRAGIPQAEAAARLDVAPQTLCRWELAREPVPPLRRAQIAALYGFDLALIAELDAAEIAQTPRERAILAAIRPLSDADQDAFLDLAEGARP